MDKKYWSKFYGEEFLNEEIFLPSTFAQFCQNEVFGGQKEIIELGCGNGRDSFHFANHGHNVTAIDQCVNSELANYRKHKNLEYIKDDFVFCAFNNHINVFYSRFTIHSITQEDENILIPKIYRHLPPKGLFCIEARTIKDPKFGTGEYVAKNTYINDGHKRRFIDSNVFAKNVLDLGFKVQYFAEKDNLSVYKNDNPVLMRIILEK